MMGRGPGQSASAPHTYAVAQGLKTAVHSHGQGQQEPVAPCGCSPGLVALQPQHFLLLKLGKSCVVVGGLQVPRACRGRQLRNSSSRYSLPCGAALRRGVKRAHSGSSLCLSSESVQPRPLWGPVCDCTATERGDCSTQNWNHLRPRRKHQHLHRHSWFALGKRKINVPSQVTQPLGVNVKPKTLLLV